MEKWFVGVDEAGRGPVAGPLVVAAFAHDLGHENPRPDLFRDSKKLPESRREAAYDEIMLLVSNGRARVYVAEATVGDIDRLGIEAAWRTAVTFAVSSVAAVCPVGLVTVDGPRFPRAEQFDGLCTLATNSPGVVTEFDPSFGVNVLAEYGRALVDADDLVWYVSAASIAAKVYRDRLMTKLWHRKYPEYGFDQHKGYGTKRHTEAILEHGLVPGLHRRAFVPKTARERAVWRAGS